MLYELPWLPVPDQAVRDALQRVNAADGAGILQDLARLAGYRWNVSEFGGIGRKVRKAISNFEGDWRGEAARAGLLPISLLFFSSNTSSHIVDPLMAVALARGILLECRVVEYQEPEAWLGANMAAVKLNPPDVALVSLDRHSLRLTAQVGNVPDAEAAIQSALDRVSLLNAKIGEAIGGTVIFENLPASANDPQSGIDAWLPGSPRFLAENFNSRLPALKPAPVVVDVAGLAILAGQDAWHAGRYWHTAKMPFAPNCVPMYAHRLVTLLSALQGKSRRVLVLDLDNTLWGGVIGDDGLEGIVLGGANALGGAHAAIQKMALQYRARGVLLTIASKNTKEVALEAIRSHPEMVLREDDITAFEINWERKSNSIRAMSELLNLGLEAFVFIDDNPAERKEVRDALPMVAVPDLPRDPGDWIPVIQAAGYFEQLALSEEDVQRTEYYRGNLKRAALHSTVRDEGEFLQSLKMEMAIAPFDGAGRKRIAQLIAKSNQFNLTTRRYSEAEIADLQADPGALTMQVRLSDIFGDNGMISVLICRTGRAIWEIDTWLMSCRVLGRGVEQVLLARLVDEARRKGATALRGIYIPSPKNGIVADHYEKLGFTRAEGDVAGATHWLLPVDSFVPKAVPITVYKDEPA